MTTKHLQPDIQQQLIQFICKNLIDDNIIMNEATPLEQLGLDSFSIIEIILFIERKYGFVIPDHLLTKETVYSVESLSKCIWENISENNKS